MGSSRKIQQHKRIRYFTWGGVALWTLVIGASLIFNIQHEYKSAHELALTTARANFFKDQAVRLWASQKGGVYVAPSARTQPSPYMAHLPDRDLVANDGRKLTLMNPNFMMREIMEDYADLFGIKGRIVGIVTLNPKNRADPWEEKAIRAFSSGTKEVIEASEIDGKPYLRLIRPMIMTPDCMKCHGHLGFKVGDVRGGVGVSVPLEEFTRQAESATKHLAATHGTIWLLGLFGIAFTSFRTRLRMEEREKALDELQLSACAFDNGLQAVVITDPGGNILRVNPIFSEITGYSAQEVMGKNPRLLSSGHHGRDFYTEFWRALRQEGRWNGEFINRRKNGEEFVALENISTVYGPEGEARYFVALFQDITERKRSQEALQRAYGENRAITEAVHDNLYMLNEAGRLVWWNKRMQDVTGLSDQELRGRVASELFVQEDREAAENAFCYCFEQGYVEVEARMLTASGPVYYHYNGVRVMDGHGRVIGIAGVGRDISERKRAEAHINQLNQELEQRVEERTAEYLAAKQEADRANRAKSEFLSAMSHELRTPLNAVLGFSQLLKLDTKLPKEERENVEEIVKAGKHLLELINEVLDLAKIEAGRIEFSLMAIPCREIANECLNLLEPMQARYNITLHAAYHVDDQVCVHADRTRLTQVLLNLLSNAIKYNRPAGSVTLRLDSPSAGMVRWSVQDTGMGIPVEHQASLFQPFSRLGADRLEVEGTGIGLTISKRVTEAMGGRMGFESTYGAGSTFWVEFPMMQGQRFSSPRSTERTVVQSASASLKGRTLLYVEDNETNIRLMESLVTLLPGLRLITATEAETGLKLARAEQPDLIIMDISLPGMDGYQALQVLQADEQTKQIPVMALSANAMASDITKGKAAGFVAYLTKPINVDELIKAIQDYISKTK